MEADTDNDHGGTRNLHRVPLSRGAITSNWTRDMTGPSGEHLGQDAKSGTRLGSGRRDLMQHRLWPTLRFLLGLGLAVLILWVLASHRDELSGLSGVFKALNWWWVPAAVAAEVMSFVCFAGMEFELLRSG